jgi:hypothetical protein
MYMYTVTLCLTVYIVYIQPYTTEWYKLFRLLVSALYKPLAGLFSYTLSMDIYIYIYIYIYYCKHTSDLILYKLHDKLLKRITRGH